MGKGKIEFGLSNSESALSVAKALLNEGYEVLLVQDEFGNMMVHFNKVAWTDETYTLITFDEIDLLSANKEKKESDE
jgi:hypothetical protein